MKQFPKLSLVTKDDAPGADDSSGQRSVQRFEVVGVEDLPVDDQALIRRQVSDMFPKASLIAVARTGRDWDLRPVITRTGEPEPSVIRFAGPDIQRSPQLTARLRESFERLRSLRELSSGLLGWSHWEKNLWFRRALVEQTLAQTLSSGKPLGAEQTLQLAHDLVAEILRWHERGVIHGHLTSANIVLKPNGKIALVDAGIGLTHAQAARGVTDYNIQSFAPEALSGQNVMYSADLYGLGMVYRRLFVLMQKNAQHEKRGPMIEELSAPLLDMSASLVDADPNRRPPLAQVKRSISETLRKFTEVEHKVRPKGRPGASPQGKIVRPGALAASPETIDTRDDEREEPVPPPQPPPPQPRVEEPQSAPVQQIEPAPPQMFPPHFQPQPQPQAPHYYAPGQPPVPPNMYQAVPGPAGPMLYPVYMQPPPHPSQSGAYQAIPPVKEEPNMFRWVMFFSLLLVGFLYYRLHGMPGGFGGDGREAMEAFREDWSSKIPSRMLTVAQAAVSKEDDSAAAEAVILASLRAGDQSSAGVNSGLLQIAFDDRWEMELSPGDRRTALALGLGNLLKQSFPRDLPTLDELHPGVLLALTASVGKGGATNLLAGVRAERLMQLPPPIGGAFRELVTANPNLSAADENVQRLARLGTRGVDIEDLAFFLREEVPVRLRALAMMYSQDNSRAQTTLEILLKDTNVVVYDQLVTWGKAFRLHEWQGLEPSDRLFVLAGIAPSTKVTAENVGKLLAHPVPSLRAVGIRSAVSAIRMEHPGALEVLQILERNPQLLRPDQTVDLIKLLVKPDSQTQEAVTSWIETNPPLDIAVPLLVTSASAKKGTVLDTALGVYLKRKNWKPDVTILRKLSQHPDGYTRLFAYNEIYLMGDRETAREFLAAAEKRETDADNKQQLQQMLLDLSH